MSKTNALPQLIQESRTTGSALQPTRKANKIQMPIKQKNTDCLQGRRIKYKCKIYFEKIKVDTWSSLEQGDGSFARYLPLRCKNLLTGSLKGEY